MARGCGGQQRQWVALSRPGHFVEQSINLRRHLIGALLVIERGQYLGHNGPRVCGGTVGSIGNARQHPIRQLGNVIGGEPRGRVRRSVRFGRWPVGLTLERVGGQHDLLGGIILVKASPVDPNAAHI